MSSTDEGALRPGSVLPKKMSGTKRKLGLPDESAMDYWSRRKRSLEETLGCSHQEIKAIEYSLQKATTEEARWEIIHEAVCD